MCKIHSCQKGTGNTIVPHFSYRFHHPLIFSSSAWLRKSTTSNHIPGHHGCFKWLVASRFLVLVKPGEAVATRRHFCNFHIRSPQIMKCKSMSVAQTTHGFLSTESQIKQGQMTYEIPSVKILQQLQMKRWFTTCFKLFMIIHVHHPCVLTSIPLPAGYIPAHIM